jgi:hypothetical protein
MRSNAVQYLGLLGLLGFLGFFTGNSYYYMFFMLFFLFPDTKKGNRSDERWARNIGRASESAFIFLLASSMLNVAYLQASGIFPLVSVLLLLIATLIFLLSYAYFDRRGD